MNRCSHTSATRNLEIEDRYPNGSTNIPDFIRSTVVGMPAVHRARLWEKAALLAIDAAGYGERWLSDEEIFMQIERVTKRIFYHLVDEWRCAECSSGQAVAA